MTPAPANGDTLRARITGVGRYLPERVLANSDLERMVETSDAWIVERSGIRERRIAADHESSGTMGARAAEEALAAAGLSGADVDLVIAATCTADGMFPATATVIQNAIGARRAGSFDVNAACTGFLTALSVGSQFVANDSAARVLVVGTETLSRIVDWTDRSTCVLFGDGAGAVVLERTPEGEPGTLDAPVLRSDGALGELLYAPGPASPRADDSPPLNGAAGTNGDRALASLSDPLEAMASCIVMDGRNVFRHAVTAMTEAAQECLDRAGVSIDEVALCVPHQANVRILSAFARNLGLPEERVYMNLERYGNTSAASIPIALAEACVEGRLAPGDRMLMVAFGAGLTWGATLVEWAGVPTPGALAPLPAALAASAARG
jgi:3-oxoacyl-[acyl-carrier-protein] synthase-3